MVNGFKQIKKSKDWRSGLIYAITQGVKELNCSKKVEQIAIRFAKKLKWRVGSRIAIAGTLVYLAELKANERFTTQKEIAKRFKITEPTMRRHKNKIIKELNLRKLQKTERGKMTHEIKTFDFGGINCYRFDDS